MMKNLYFQLKKVLLKMGSNISQTHSIRKSLKTIEFNGFRERDYYIISQQTGLDIKDVQIILNDFLAQNLNGIINRKAYCSLYQTLTKKDSSILDILSKDLFSALGVEKSELDTAFISFNEFLITFVLTTRGDLRKKLEYVFEMYDDNNENALELSNVKAIVHGILEFYKPIEEVKDIEEISKECLKHLKITEVVRKGYFNNSLKK